MASMTDIICKCGCGRNKKVRTADVKRGWGKFFSKSCKARHQERRTGQYKDLLHGKKKSGDFRDVEDDFHVFDSYALGQD